MRQLIVLLSISLTAVGAKELFTVEMIQRYLTKSNPYVYGAIGQQYIDQAKVTTAKGNFDTKLSIAYDNKEYPASTGEYSHLSLSKPLLNGTELLLGYRKAEGTQEYNNIKTGSEGEYRIGVTLPLIDLLQNINSRKYQLNTTQINAEKSRLDAQNNLRHLYTKVVFGYYQLLYYHALYAVEQQLLLKAKKRNAFIVKRVDSGDLSDIQLLESQQQIINREQRILTAKNTYNQALQTFLKYLNLPQKRFESDYTLPTLTTLHYEKLPLGRLVDRAIQNRPDLKALQQKRAKLGLESDYNQLSKYPKVNLFAYGVHDLKYGEGIKVGVNFDIPLERRGYEGKKVEIQEGITQLDEEENRLLLDLKTNLSTLCYHQDILEKNIVFGKKEIAIVTRLERAENQRYEVGSSDLFQVNQREMAALQVKQKQIAYYLNALLIAQEIKREIGESLSL